MQTSPIVSIPEVSPKRRQRSNTKDQKVQRTGQSQPSTAVILAAGLGTRLMPITRTRHKCLVEVQDKAILGHLLDDLIHYQFRKVIIVVGHLEQQIRNYVHRHYLASTLEFEFVTNPQYTTTNNIFSLWLARHLIDDDFLLADCDVIFSRKLLGALLFQDRAAIGKFQSFMSGATVGIDSAGFISGYSTSKARNGSSDLFKTVNLYSISKESWRGIREELEGWISAGKTDFFYEAVFAELITRNLLAFKSVDFDLGAWYEIDTWEDLSTARRLFPSGGSR